MATGIFRSDDDRYYDDEMGDVPCGQCQGRGRILHCPDDLCRGADDDGYGCGKAECSHACPVCEGRG